MEYSAIIGKVEKQQVACIVCAIYDDKQLPPTIKLLDEQSNGYISKLLKSGDINGNLGQSLILHNVPNLLCKRILVIGCGKKEKFQAQNFKQVCNAAITSLINSNITAACISLEQDLLFAEKTPNWSIQQIMISFANKLYRFNKYKNKTDLSKIALKKISNECYKIVLYCANHNIEFYEKLGFIKKEFGYFFLISAKFLSDSIRDLKLPTQTLYVGVLKTMVPS